MGVYYQYLRISPAGIRGRISHAEYVILCTGRLATNTLTLLGLAAFISARSCTESGNQKTSPQCLLRSTEVGCRAQFVFVLGFVLVIEDGNKSRPCIRPLGSKHHPPESPFHNPPQSLKWSGSYPLLTRSPFSSVGASSSGPQCLYGACHQAAPRSCAPFHYQRASACASFVCSLSPNQLVNMENTLSSTLPPHRIHISAGR